jgi:hypothetical protein
MSSLLGETLLVLDGMVLDITRWLDEHPGGSSIIPEQALDVDCTAFFEARRARFASRRRRTDGAALKRACEKRRSRPPLSAMPPLAREKTRELLSPLRKSRPDRRAASFVPTAALDFPSRPPRCCVFADEIYHASRQSFLYLREFYIGASSRVCTSSPVIARHARRSPLGVVGLARLRRCWPLWSRRVWFVFPHLIARAAPCDGGAACAGELAEEDRARVPKPSALASQEAGSASAAFLEEVRV